MSIHRALLAFTLFALVGTAYATVCKEYQSPFLPNGPWHKTMEQSCAAELAYHRAQPDPDSTTSGGAVEGQTCVFQRFYMGKPVHDLRSNQNSRERECTDQCLDRANTSEIINVTAAWQRTPSTAPNQDWLYPSKWKFGASNSVCGADMCEQSFDPLEPCTDCTSYVSQTPATNGMYRVSVEMQGHYSGKTCTPSDTDKLVTPSDKVDPPCPGFVGEVNGVRGCYGTAEKPVRPEASSGPAGSSDKDPGNPAAGPKPPSGPGSGVGGESRTPSTGTGGSAGGPASAAGTGKKPDGTTTKPTEGKEQAACGAPGQPKCKIDETGTPDGSGQKDKFTDAVKKAGEDTKAGIENASKLKADGWTFAFLLPTGCTPLQLPGYADISQGTMVVDPCRYQSPIHDLLSLVWIGVTIWAIVGMVGSTLRGA